MSCSPPPADLTGYDPPTSLWKLVENNVPEHEREELKNMLGESLVEQSLELHLEIETLLEIWRDYREETQEAITMKAPKRLPEPPAVRDRLRQEICFFVERIRAKSREMGSNAEHVLAKHNNEVLEYVMEQKRPESVGYFSRPSTARSSRDGRETPICRLGTPTSDRFSGTSMLSEEVESMQDKLNVLKLDEVTTHLRQTLEEEIEFLLTDINFLQGCLEDEADFRSQSSMSNIDCEPSLSELRAERNQLERDLLERESPVPDVLRDNNTTSLRHKTSFTKNYRKLSGIEKSPSPPVPHSSMKTRAAVSPGSAGRSRPVPLKASHQIPCAAQIITVHQTDPNVEISRGSSGRRARSIGRENLLTTEDAPTHVTVRTGSPSSLPRSARLVRVGSVPAPRDGAGEGHTVRHTPTPPPNSRPAGARPSSASKFRRMVLGCRDQDEPIGGPS